MKRDFAGDGFEEIMAPRLDPEAQGDTKPLKEVEMHNVHHSRTDAALLLWD